MALLKESTRGSTNMGGHDSVVTQDFLKRAVVLVLTVISDWSPDVSDDNRRKCSRMVIFSETKLKRVLVPVIPSDALRKVIGGKQHRLFSRTARRAAPPSSFCHHSPMSGPATVHVRSCSCVHVLMGRVVFVLKSRAPF